MGRGRQPPLVLKPETTRSGLIYREDGGGGGRRETRITEGEREGRRGMEGGVHEKKNIDACQMNKTSCGHA